MASLSLTVACQSAGCAESLIDASALHLAVTKHLAAEHVRRSLALKSSPTHAVQS
jgi:hypothetical protein